MCESASSPTTRRRPGRVRRTYRAHPDYCRPGRKRNAVYRELGYGAAVYFTCIFLPHLPAVLFRLYMVAMKLLFVIRRKAIWIVWIFWRCSVEILTRLGWIDFGQGMSNSSGAQGGQDTESGSRLGTKLRRLFYSTSTASIWEEFNSQQQEQDISREQFTWGYGKPFMDRWSCSVRHPLSLS